MIRGFFAKVNTNGVFASDTYSLEHLLEGIHAIKSDEHLVPDPEHSIRWRIVNAMMIGTNFKKIKI